MNNIIKKILSFILDLLIMFKKILISLWKMNWKYKILLIFILMLIPEIRAYVLFALYNLIN